MEIALNIVDLIENNPITGLTNTFQNKLLSKIKLNFTEEDQHLFVANFYCFLNYNRNDFVIDLDNVWKWLEITTKQKAKDLLEKHFTINKDYQLLLLNEKNKQQHIKGGHNKETFMLTIRAFKLYCLKIGTKKADKIHEYYIKLEETLQEVICEESSELKLQLEFVTINSEKDKKSLREKNILEQFPNNTQCVYYGTISNESNSNEKLIKFGNSNNLKNRVVQHRDTYSDFCLVNAFRVENKLQIENALKENKIFNDRQRTITLKNKKYVELLNMDELSFSELDKIIKDIIISIEYSPENYKKILEDIKLLKIQIDQNVNINNTNNLMLLTAENKHLKMDNIRLIQQCNYFKQKLGVIEEPESNDIETETDATEIVNGPTEKELENYNILSHDCNKNMKKHKDGKYHINGKIFDKLYGSRQLVWDEVAYQTTGLLLKNDFMINKTGTIVSKKKSVSETNYKRFELCNVNKPRETK